MRSEVLGSSICSSNLISSLNAPELLNWPSAFVRTRLSIFLAAERYDQRARASRPIHLKAAALAPLHRDLCRVYRGIRGSGRWPDQITISAIIPPNNISANRLDD